MVHYRLVLLIATISAVSGVEATLKEGWEIKLRLEMGRTELGTYILRWNKFLSLLRVGQGDNKKFRIGCKKFGAGAKEAHARKWRRRNTI